MASDRAAVIGHTGRAHHPWAFDWTGHMSVILGYDAGGAGLVEIPPIAYRGGGEGAELLVGDEAAGGQDGEADEDEEPQRYWGTL